MLDRTVGTEVSERPKSLDRWMKGNERGLGVEEERGERTSVKAGGCSEQQGHVASIVTWRSDNLPVLDEHVVECGVAVAQEGDRVSHRRQLSRVQTVARRVQKAVRFAPARAIFRVQVLLEVRLDPIQIQLCVALHANTI